MVLYILSNYNFCPNETLMNNISLTEDKSHKKDDLRLQVLLSHWWLIDFVTNHCISKSRTDNCLAIIKYSHNDNERAVATRQSFIQNKNVT